MEDWEQRIHSVLGDDSGRSGETALRYLAHLRRVLKFPLRVTGREDFPFNLGLSWLTTGQEDTPEFQILDDYATWHANY